MDLDRPKTLLACGCAAAVFAALAAEPARVAGEGAIRDEWTLAPGTTLAVPVHPGGAAAHEQACVSLGYLIGRDGSTSAFALLGAWSSAEVAREAAEAHWRPFAEAAAAAVAQWRFQPLAGADARPTYTVATLAFGGKGDRALMRHCAVPNLAARLRELGYRVDADGLHPLGRTRKPADRNGADGRVVPVSYRPQNHRPDAEKQP